eukprot:1134145-Pelagomonas_calceolata.AAC.1
MGDLKTLSTAYLTKREGTNLHIRRQLNSSMRARQFISIHSSKLHLMKNGNSVFKEDLELIYKALSLHKPPPHNLSSLMSCIMQTLLNLGINWLHELTSPRKTHFITVAQLQAKYPKVNTKCNIALNRLAALANLAPEEELSTSSIQKIIAFKNTEANILLSY